MNFLFNASCYKPAFKQGGPIYSVSALAEGLIRRGHEVTVLTPDLDLFEKMDVPLDRNVEIEGVQVRFFKTKPALLQRTRLPYFSRAGVYAHGPEVAEWLQRVGKSIDVFHSQISFLPTNSLVSRYAKAEGKLYLYSQRGNLDPVRLKAGSLKKRIYIELIEKNVMRRADALIALTPYEQDSFRRWVPEVASEVIANGIEKSYGEKAPSVVSKQLGHLFLRCGQEMVFLWMSRIHPLKGPDIFVQAAIRALQAGARFHAILAGPDEAAMESALKAMVMESGFGDRVHFCGTVKGADKLALLQRADCFVLPTESEGFSMALLEALACRCAVLTSSGAHFDAIAHVGAGRVIPRTIESYAGAMCQYSEAGRSVLGEIARRGRGLIESHYTWDAVILKYLALVKRRLGVASKRYIK